MRLVFAGTPEVAVPSLRAELDSARHEVLAVRRFCAAVAESAGVLSALGAVLRPRL